MVYCSRRVSTGASVGVGEGMSAYSFAVVPCLCYSCTAELHGRYVPVNSLSWQRYSCSKCRTMWEFASDGTGWYILGDGNHVKVPKGCLLVLSWEAV